MTASNCARAVLWALAGAALGAAGCEVGPDYHAPATTMPAAFADGARPTTVAATTATTRPVDLARWWESLNDPELDSLVRQAIVGNPDLEIALTRLQEARASEAAVVGVALPEVGLSAGAGRGSGTNSVKGRDSAILDSGTDTAGLREITQVVGFDASWELDLFGRYRREIEAAHADTQTAAAARNAVLITLVSDVARAYVDLRALQLRLGIARDDIHAEEQTVRFVQARFDRGLTNELDLALARRQLASEQALVAPLEAAVTRTRYRLAVLLGRFPDDPADELMRAGALPLPPSGIEPGLPIELLRRRPDIREAERALAAQTARVGVAVADLFPRVSVTGGIGLQGQGLGRTPNTNSLLWTVGPSAYWPVLDFGTLDSLVQVQELRTHEQLLNYKRTVLAAVEEVDDAIADFTAEREHLRMLGEALAAAQRAESLASQRYDRGITDFLNVLDAQRQLYDLEDQYASAQATVVLQFIAVYKGLGGGWQPYQHVPAIRGAQPAVMAAVREIATSRPGKSEEERSPQRR